MKETLHFPSANAAGDIFGDIWPVDDAKAVVQLVHGMAEHIGRYAHFAAFLNARGYTLAGHDHAGHGRSVHTRKGHIADKDGLAVMLADVSSLRAELKARYPDKKMVLMGHSMGSFVARTHAERFPGAYDGYIFMGSGGPNPLARPGRMLARLRALFRGRKPDPVLDRMAFSTYLDRIPNPATPFDWLSSRPDMVQAYMDDEFAGFQFTSAAFGDLLEANIAANRPLAAFDTAKPVLLLSGGEDPVGDYGHGHTFILRQLSARGVQNVTEFLYPQGRHELLNDTMADTVMADIAEWLDAL